MVGNLLFKSSTRISFKGRNGYSQVINRDLYDIIVIILMLIDHLISQLGVTAQDLKQSVILKQKDNTFYLMLNTKGNVFTKEFVRAIHRQLDIVQKNEGATALVTVSLQKLFSGGLNLKYLSDLPNQDKRHFVQETIALFGRLTGFPMPTICLVRGGAVAGGAMLAFSHDYIFVAGKAMIQVNQAQTQMFLPPGMMSVIRKRHSSPAVLRDMVITAKKFEAEEALQHKFIDGIWKEQDALRLVHEKAQSIADFGYNKENMKKIKYEMHKDVIRDCFAGNNPYSVVGYSPMQVQAKL